MKEKTVSKMEMLSSSVNSVHGCGLMQYFSSQGPAQGDQGDTTAGMSPVRTLLVFTATGNIIFNLVLLIPLNQNHPFRILTFSLCTITIPPNFLPSEPHLLPTCHRALAQLFV